MTLRCGKKKNVLPFPEAATALATVDVVPSLFMIVDAPKSTPLYSAATVGGDKRQLSFTKGFILARMPQIAEQKGAHVDLTIRIYDAQTYKSKNSQVLYGLTSLISKFKNFFKSYPDWFLSLFNTPDPRKSRTPPIPFSC